MVNWCKIAESILETEFPSFGLLAHLGNAVAISKSTVDLGATNIKSLKVLAKTWNIDKELRGKGLSNRSLILFGGSAQFFSSWI